LGAYKDYKGRQIIHFSHLILATKIKLERYKGRPTNRLLWKYSMQELEAIMNALHEREDANGIND